MEIGLEQKVELAWLKVQIPIDLHTRVGVAAKSQRKKLYEKVPELLEKGLAADKAELLDRSRLASVNLHGTI
ncbi:MAG: hypothetical protein NUV65_05895 [Candidatus Roizmanbacteria bacterium]|nr:hypothetical protein [Candidatus Roizmanbacteria bacterium]